MKIRNRTGTTISLVLGSLLCVAFAVAGCGPSEPSPDAAPAVSEEPGAHADPDLTICTSPVRPVVMTAVERFAQWTGGSNSVPAGTSPAGSFSVVPSLPSLNDKNVYVVTHGWAPGWNQAVIDAGTKIHWWAKQAGIECDASTGHCVWPSNFAWAPSSVTVYGNLIEVTKSGLLPAIVAADPKAVVLAYSWLDDSATEGGLSGQLTCAYHSEAYTNLNGLRLAYGLEQILGAGFWDRARGNRLHLIGHSHGTKVVTTATRALQQGGFRVDQLTILDSPEDFDTREIGAANFNWLYLAEMNITTSPLSGGADSVFVDNYVSEFGMRFTDFGQLSEVVDVQLDPQELYGSLPEDWGDDHTYAATWYAGAAPGGAKLGTKIGLAWSPLLDPSVTAGLGHGYQQTWPEVTTREQFVLAAQAPTPGDGFELATATFSDAQPSGPGIWDSSNGTATFGSGGSGSESLSLSFGCDWEPPFHDPDDYEGLAFGVRFENTTSADQLVVLLGGSRYMVLDGGAVPSCTASPCTHKVSFNAGNESSSLELDATLGSGGGMIVLSDFRCIELWD